MHFCILENKVTVPIAKSSDVLLKITFLKNGNFPIPSYAFKIFDTQNTPDGLLLTVLSASSSTSSMVLIVG